MIESERKYLIKNIDKKVDKLKKNSIKKVGIIQWYEDDKETEERTRLTIFYDKIIGHTHLWEKTTKKPTKDPQKRIEDEKILDPRKEVNLSDFENKKSVVKIRYILKENPEIVLDEFLEIDNSKDFKSITKPIKRYLLEIEERQNECDFDKELKDLGLELGKDLEDVTENKEYKNIQMAKNSYLKPLGIIDYVQNRLIGPITVILTQGVNRDKSNESKDESRKMEKVKEFIEKVKNENEYTEYRAETDALYLFMKSGFEVKKAHFLVFPTFEKDEDYPKEYEYLKELVEKLFELESGYSPINYDPSRQDSAYNSFQEIFKTVSNIIKENESILIDLTGGQKYPGIELAIYSLFNKKAFYYKQQNKINNDNQKEMVQLKFPPLPIGWNNETIDDYSPYFDLISSKELNKESVNYDVFITLPEFLKDLFSISLEGKFITVPILGEIKKNYDNARRMPFGHGKNFIDLIRDDEMMKFVNEKIPSWSLRWIGDLIPETVEHSQRHSKRLMEFGFNLVRIMGEENFLSGIPRNLRKEFYFILSVAMNVHDLGHTVLNYKTDDGINLCVDGLPSVVRDLHSELSYQLIKDGTILNGIEEIDKDKDKTERLKKAIMYVSKYHRQYLPISKDENPSNTSPKEFVENLKIKVKSLEERLDEDDLFRDLREWKEMIMLAARWLKFIDSTDVQSDRTVMDEYTEVRIKRTKEEIQNLCNDLLTNNSKICELCIYEQIFDILNYLEKEDWNNLDHIAKEIEKMVYKNIKSKIEDAIKNGKDKIFVDEYIKKTDRIAFKSRQFLHFEKHQAVKSIMPEFYNPQSKTLYLKIYPDENSKGEIIKSITRDIKHEIKHEFEQSQINKFNKKLEKLEIES